jgi:hypothetical protein
MHDVCSSFRIRLVFFPDSTSGPVGKWADAAARDPDPFRDEDQRAADRRSRKNAARARNQRSGKRKTPKRRSAKSRKKKKSR